MPKLARKDLLLQRIQATSADIRGAENEYLERGYYNALSLIETIYGRESRQAEDLQEARKKLSFSLRNGEGEENPELDFFRYRVEGMLDATYDNLEVGLIGDLEAEISASVISDFVMLAKTYLAEGQKDVAAVLASAAFEDAIKRKAIARNLVVEGKEIHEITNALVRERVIRGPQTGFVEGYRKLRNYAMHAN